MMDKRVICLLAVFLLVAATPMALAISVGMPSFFNINQLSLFAPRVENVTANPLIANQTQIVNISANVNDDSAINSVFANVTLPNSSTLLLNMSNPSANFFLTNFTTTSSTAPGLYNVQILANGSSGLVNNTERANFTVVDNIAPNIVLTNPLNAVNRVVNASFEVSATSTESFVDKVIANITAPSGNSTQLPLIIAGSKYNASFMASEIGNYTLFITANDTSGNTNTTTQTTFSVIYSDSAPPQVSIISPAVNATYFVSAVVPFNVNATDVNTSVASVIANITLPNSSILILTLTDNDNDGIFVGNMTDMLRTGTYNAQVIATDVAGNVNNTETAAFSKYTNNLFEIIDSDGNVVPLNYTIMSAVDNLSTINVTFGNHTIKNLVLINYSNASQQTVVKLEPSTNDTANTVNTYSIDLSNINITSAQISVVAVGDELYKCADFNFTSQTCAGNYSFVRNLVKGQEYIMNLTANDPGFQEKLSPSSPASADEGNGVSTARGAINPSESAPAEEASPPAEVPAEQPSSPSESSSSEIPAEPSKEEHPASVVSPAVSIQTPNAVKRSISTIPATNIVLILLVAVALVGNIILNTHEKHKPLINATIRLMEKLPFRRALTLLRNEKSNIHQKFKHEPALRENYILNVKKPSVLPQTQKPTHNIPAHPSLIIRKTHINPSPAPSLIIRKTHIPVKTHLHEKSQPSHSTHKPSLIVRKIHIKPTQPVKEQKFVLKTRPVHIAQPERQHHIPQKESIMPKPAREQKFVLKTKPFIIPQQKKLPEQKPFIKSQPAKEQGFVLKTRKVDIVNDRIQKDVLATSLQTARNPISQIVRQFTLPVKPIKIFDDRQLDDKKGAILAQLRTAHKSASPAAYAGQSMSDRVSEILQKKTETAEKKIFQNPVVEAIANAHLNNSSDILPTKTKFIKSRQEMLDSLKEVHK